MNPLIKKEIRLLLPTFLIGCGLALSNLLLRDSRSIFNGLAFVIPLLFCPTIAIMIALESFGAEVASGTLTSLLAQPVPRQKIWQTKIVVLAISLLILGIIYCSTLFLRQAIPTIFGGWLNLLSPAITFILVVYSGALWAVLLLRQVAAAFWFTVLVPGVIVMIFAGLYNGENGDFIEGLIVVALGIYTLAGFFFARWLFMRAQDVQWSGGTIAMPEMRGIPAWFTRLTAWRATHSRATLWRKEFQLQQSQYIMAFVLVILHLGVLATRKWGHFTRNSAMLFILESFWFLWLVMPFIVGCAAAAEERKLGTHESQLCLPVKRRTQFTIKLSVVVFLSLLFGVAMPLLFEGGQVLPNIHIQFLNVFNDGYWQRTPERFFWNCLAALNQCWPLLLFMVIAAGIGWISFFVSTLARNTLQAMAPALGGIIVMAFLIDAAYVEGWAYYPLWRGDLIYLIGVPVISLTLLALAYQNFLQVSSGWRMWLRNLLAISASLVFVVILTTEIYHRAWEKLTTFEPPHGAARLTLSNPASLSSHRNELFVRLPDGRIWTDLLEISPTASSPVALALGNFEVDSNSGTFLSGSGWANAERSSWDLVGIKNNGTLWASEESWRAGKLGTLSVQQNENNLRQLVQFGTETDWSGMELFNPGALLIKTDGTLWRWGPDRFDTNKKPWPGLRSFTPHRLGTESNWVGLAESFLQKADGSFWAADFFSYDTNHESRLNLGGGLTAYRVTGSGKFRSTASVWEYFDWQAGIRDNGSFCIWAEQKLVTYPGKRNDYGNWEWAGTDLPIGTGTNWLAVAGTQRNTVTLKDDGTLWSWNFGSTARDFQVNAINFKSELPSTVPTRLGTHSDWIAIASGYGYVLSLAADGSLWYWPMEEPSYYGGENQFEPLLDISRKPQFIGNVFSASTITH